MLIAHFSDIHMSRHWSYENLLVLNNKQRLAYGKWYKSRKKHHDFSRLDIAVTEIIKRKVDHIIITGDLCQLGHDKELDELRDRLSPLLAFRHLSKVPVHIVKGNHDLYGGSRPSEKWASFFSDFGSKDESVCKAFKVETDDCHLLFAGLARTNKNFRILKATGKLRPDVQCKIEEWLSQIKDNKPIILSGHFPLCKSNGDPLKSNKKLKNGDVIREWIDRYNIAAYLCGHEHDPYTYDFGNGRKQYCAGSLTRDGVVNFIEVNNGILNVDVFKP